MSGSESLRRFSIEVPDSRVPDVAVRLGGMAARGEIRASERPGVLDPLMCEIDGVEVRLAERHWGVVEGEYVDTIFSGNMEAFARATTGRSNIGSQFFNAILRGYNKGFHPNLADYVRLDQAGRAIGLKAGDATLLLNHVEQRGNRSTITNVGPKAVEFFRGFTECLEDAQFGRP